MKVLNPDGRPIPLAGPGREVLGPLTESKAAEILSRVKELRPTDSDEEAVVKITR